MTRKGLTNRLIFDQKTKGSGGQGNSKCKILEMGTCHVSWEDNVAGVGEERERVLGEKVVRFGRKAVLPSYRSSEAMVRCWHVKW